MNVSNRATKRLAIRMIVDFKKSSKNEFSFNGHTINFATREIDFSDKAMWLWMGDLEDNKELEGRLSTCTNAQLNDFRIKTLQDILGMTINSLDKVEERISHLAIMELEKYNQIAS